MVIVEGPDGAGKTTLCKTLSAQFGLEIVNWQVELGLARDEMKVYPARRYYYALAEEFQMNAERTALEPAMIHDRLYFSSLVYGPIMEGSNQMTEEDRKTIARILIATACPIIVCLPPKSVVVENVRGDGHQMDGVGAVIEDIYDLYPAVVRADSFPFVMYYDYTGEQTGANFHTIEALNFRVASYLERRSKRGIQV